MFGRYFEDFQVGDVIHHDVAKTITESDNNLFCLLTMNYHPLHLDAEYATRTQHGKRVVVGTYIISLVVGMSVADISGLAIANLNYSDIKHLSPVFLGDTIHAQTQIIDARRSKSRPDRGIIKVLTVAFNQHGERILTLTREVLVPRRKA